MGLQAYIDESVDEDGTWIMAGYVATEEQWARFSAEWENMLRRGTLSPTGSYHFKMSEMATLSERMERVSGFYRIIENNVIQAISVKSNRHDVERAISRISIPQVGIDWGSLSNPYFSTFRVLMDHFHSSRARDTFSAYSIPKDAKVNFIFDDHTDKSKVLSAWENYLSARSNNSRRLYGDLPKFQNDQVSLPLQAADLWAWWVRRWEVAGNASNAIAQLDFGYWRGRGPTRTHISMTEDQWLRSFVDIITPLVPSLRPIFDTKTGRVLGLGKSRRT